MQSKATTVDEYIAELPVERRPVLEQLRGLVRDAAPLATECMRYGMPSYELGELLCAMAAQKAHYSVYVMDTRVVERYRSQLGKLSVGRGCIRFRKIEQVPLDVLSRILLEAATRRRKGITALPCDDA